MRVNTQEYAEKKALIMGYQENFGLYFNLLEQNRLFKQLDTVGVELFLKKKVEDQRTYVAAACIQKVFRGYLTRKWHTIYHQVKDRSARMIQRNWKRFFRTVVIPYRRRAAQKRVALSIQKVMRGYLGRKHMTADRNQQKMEQNFAFFDAIRDEMK